MDLLVLFFNLFYELESWFWVCWILLFIVIVRLFRFSSVDQHVSIFNLSFSFVFVAIGLFGEFTFLELADIAIIEFIPFFYIASLINEFISF